MKNLTDSLSGEDRGLFEWSFDRTKKKSNDYCDNGDDNIVIILWY
jgi:hypothetical protein